MSTLNLSDTYTPPNNFFTENDHLFLFILLLSISINLNRDWLHLHHTFHILFLANENVCWTTTLPAKLLRLERTQSDICKAETMTFTFGLLLNILKRSVGEQVVISYLATFIRQDDLFHIDHRGQFEHDM